MLLANVTVQRKHPTVGEVVEGRVSGNEGQMIGGEERDQRGGATTRAPIGLRCSPAQMPSTLDIDRGIACGACGFK